MKVLVHCTFLDSVKQMSTLFSIDIFITSSSPTEYRSPKSTNKSTQNSRDAFLYSTVLGYPQSINEPTLLENGTEPSYRRKCVSSMGIIHCCCYLNHEPRMPSRGSCCLQEEIRMQSAENPDRRILLPSFRIRIVRHIISSYCFPFFPFALLLVDLAGVSSASSPLDNSASSLTAAESSLSASS